MVAAVAAVGIVYGSLWAARQAPKFLGLIVGLELWKAKKKIEDYERVSRLGFDVIRDLNDASFGVREFHGIRFREGSLHERLKFLEEVDLLLTSEETFILKKAMDAVSAGEPVVPVRFNRLIEVSKARLGDERFAEEVMSKDG